MLGRDGAYLGAVYTCSIAYSLCSTLAAILVATYGCPAWFRGRGDLGWPKFTRVLSNFNKLSKQVIDFSYLIRYLLHIFSARGCYQLQVGEYTQARHSSDSEASELAWRFLNRLLGGRRMEQMATSVIIEARHSIL